MSTRNDTVHLLLRPGPAGHAPGQFVGAANGKRMTFRRGGVVQMDRATAEAFCAKYNGLTGDYRGIFFVIQEVQEVDPAPAMSTDVGELQSTVASLQTQMEAQGKALVELMAMNRDLFAKLSEKDGLTVHPKPASAAESAEAANAAKAKPKKGVQAMTTSTFKTGEEG